MHKCVHGRDSLVHPSVSLIPAEQERKNLDKLLCRRPFSACVATLVCTAWLLFLRCLPNSTCGCEMGCQMVSSSSQCLLSVYLTWREKHLLNKPCICLLNMSAPVKVECRGFSMIKMLTYLTPVIKLSECRLYFKKVLKTVT